MVRRGAMHLLKMGSNLTKEDADRARYLADVLG